MQVAHAIWVDASPLGLTLPSWKLCFFFLATYSSSLTCAGLDPKICVALALGNVAAQLNGHAARVDANAADPGRGEQQGEHAPASDEIIKASLIGETRASDGCNRRVGSIMGARV